MALPRLRRRRPRPLARHLLGRCWLVAVTLLASPGVPASAPATAEPPFVVPIPTFVDCTGAEHGDWALFRRLFTEGAAETRRNLAAQAVEEPTTTGARPAVRGALAPEAFPAFEATLLREAMRLHQKWLHVLAAYNEDYPPGAADFYHCCHFDEETDYCLYGHVAVLAILARHVQHGSRYELTRAAMRLLSWNHCLDFLESSSWGFSVLDLWDEAQNFVYPQVSLLHQHLYIGEGSGSGGSPAASPDAAGVAPAQAGGPYFWVFEIGIHQALSNEPISWLQRVLPGHTVLHQNYVKSYGGRAEAFRHPFPRECSPNCKYQQESVPYTFPVFEDMEESGRNFKEFLLRTELSKPEVRSSSVLLCTNPIFYCNFFAGINHTLIGYFGLPLMYMVPKEGWDSWARDFVAIASSPKSFFVANNPLLAEQLAWQSGVRVPVLRPLALYMKDAYYPTRMTDVLVPEPREACVLNCLLRKFTPPGYPLKFFEKADTDRKFRTFVTFRSVVLFPHDYALMLFYEFYACSVPIFVPAHLSKYLFPYSATVPLLDWVPEWLRSGQPLENAGDRPKLSPLSMTSVDSLRHWSNFMDFFLFPGIQLFPSIAGLLEMLPTADLHGISAQMRAFRLVRLLEATRHWDAVVVASFQSAGASAMPTSLA